MNEKLIKIQNELSVPKNQRNTFGNYNYRSCEDILEAVKPLLEKYDLLLTISDSLVNIGDRYYVKAECRLHGVDGSGIETYGFAREEETKKGMDGSQITGAASSYARKYALNAMFLIDDTKDSDSTNDHSEKVSTESPARTVQSSLGACEHCGADMILSARTGKPYCSKKCWLDNQPAVKTMAYPPKEQAVTAEDEPINEDDSVNPRDYDEITQEDLNKLDL
jgi:hypothetical protein